MRCYGPSSKSVTNVRRNVPRCPSNSPPLFSADGLRTLTMLTSSSSAGSRYIYDLYYEKQAISKQLYDWLLKNNYADANLIAKWKKQGYEKVRCALCVYKTVG